MNNQHQPLAAKISIEYKPHGFYFIDVINRGTGGLGCAMKKSSGHPGHMRLHNYTLFRRNWDGSIMIWQSVTLCL